ncbi:MAG: diguanylate cyclase [Acidobacteriota bacterium]|nr:diguanylate cyclase [Acidobacteriota bacterium]
MADIAKRLEKADKYLQKGKQKDALEEYLAILDDDPNQDAVRQSAADLCIALGDPGEAAKHLSTLFDRQAQSGNAAGALNTYKKLVRAGQPTVDQVLKHAQFAEKKGDKKEATEGFHAAAKALLAAGRKKDAATAYKSLVVLEPSLDNWKQFADLSAETGDAKAAGEAYFQAAELEKKAGADPLATLARGYGLDAANTPLAIAYGAALTDNQQAAAAIAILEPLATMANSAPEAREPYARALIGADRPLEAEPFVWELFEKDPARYMDSVGLIVGALISAEHHGKALALSHKLEEHEIKRGRRREYVEFIKGVTEAHPPAPEFLEYLVEIFNASNREADYCNTLVKLFELYYAMGNFLKASDSLDRAAEVDPYEPGHKKRLEMVRGKIDLNRFNTIANRFAAAGGGPGDDQPQQKMPESEPTVLEDFILQAEIYIQYGMRSKAIERLERVNKLFPHEEDKNEKLRNLYMNAGMVPKYDGAPATPAPASSRGPAQAAAAPPAPMPQPMHDESAVDNISRVTEITRNIYRQSNVKGVLFAAVNDVGRHFGASRCIAGLCVPGKPPSAALEYCAPGVKQSDVMAIVKLLGILQQIAMEQGFVSLPDAPAAPELGPVLPFLNQLDIRSILAVPLLDGDEQAGMIILEQCGKTREWRETDIVVLRTIADQTALACSNAKLRSLMKTLAVTDEKSGLLKRSSYLDVLMSETRRAVAQSATSTLMLVHFGKSSSLVKEIGEQAVENMMTQLGQAICSHVRQNDVAIRYELTTIAVVLADTNDKNAFFVVDKLRKVLGTVKVPGTDKPPPMTVGIAEAVMQGKFDPVDVVTEVINRADDALDAAKAEGPGTAKSIAAELEVAAVA